MRPDWGLPCDSATISSVMHAVQAMLGDLLNSTLNRAGLGGRRRYRIISRHEPRQQNHPQMPALTVAPNQHQYGP